MYIYMYSLYVYSLPGINPSNSLPTLKRHFYFNKIFIFNFIFLFLLYLESDQFNEWFPGVNHHFLGPVRMSETVTVEVRGK